MFSSLKTLISVQNDHDYLSEIYPAKYEQCQRFSSIITRKFDFFNNSAQTTYLYKQFISCKFCNGQTADTLLLLKSFD